MAKKRANGEGNIRKRKDGRWEGRFTVGHDPATGKQIFKNVLGKTQTEVKKKLKKGFALENQQYGSGGGRQFFVSPTHRKLSEITDEDN